MAKSQTKEIKAKARPVVVGNLMVVSAWEKTYSTGSTGFFGQAMDGTGVKYQITAIKIGSKPGKS